MQERAERVRAEMRHGRPRVDGRPVPGLVPATTKPTTGPRGAALVHHDDEGRRFDIPF